MASRCPASAALTNHRTASLSSAATPCPSRYVKPSRTIPQISPSSAALRNQDTERDLSSGDSERARQNPRRTIDRVCPASEARVNHLIASSLLASVPRPILKASPKAYHTSEVPGFAA